MKMDKRKPIRNVSVSACIIFMVESTKKKLPPEIMQACMISYDCVVRTLLVHLIE